MENEVVTLRIDNPPEELRDLLQSDFTYVDFKDGVTIGQYICEAIPGTYLLTTRSEKQPRAVHVSVLQNGILKDKDLSPDLLNRKLIDVHMVSNGKPSVN